jgi:hypothetical protein
MIIGRINMKRKLPLLLLLIFACVSCARDASAIPPGKPPSKSNGAAGGVWVDAEGNLRIEADLFVVDRDPENPGLKRADISRNGTVTAFIYPGTHYSASGSLSNGHFSLSIPVPEDDDLETAVERFYFWPDDWFTKGANVKVGFLYFELIYLDDADGVYDIYLIANPGVEFMDNDSWEHGYYSVKGNVCDYHYSQGELIINGATLTINEWGISDDSVNISFTRGWNVFYDSVIYDEETNTDSIVISSKNPPANAVWVLMD